MTFPSKRDYLLDACRGVLLILMTLDHTALFFKEFLFQPIGAISAAECFVFISGFVYGLVYSRYLDQPSFLWKKTYKRIFTIFQYHLAIFVILLAEHYVVLYFTGKGLHPEWSKVTEDMPVTIIRFLTLNYNPHLFLLLPMYMFFLSFSPLVLSFIHKKKAWVPILISIAIWAVSIGLKNPYFIDVFNDHNLSSNYRVFNPLSWQLLIVAGIYFGHSSYIGKLFKRSKLLFAMSLLYCVAFLIFRRVDVFYESPFFSSIFSSRSLLEPFRLINFFSFVYVFFYLTKNLELRRRNYLAFLGQYSIDVFVFHILIIYNVMKSTHLYVSLPVIWQILIAFGLIWGLSIAPTVKEAYVQKDFSLQFFKQRILLLPNDIIGFFRKHFSMVRLKRRFILLKL